MNLSQENGKPEKRTFVSAKAKDVHHSSILPERTHERELADSVKNLGIQQFLIVRPHPSIQNQYELIDGQGRLAAIDPEQDVWLDVRHGISDASVFRIAESTLKRTQRNTYENAMFYAKYVETVIAESGVEGAQTRVTQESHITESLLSQYLTIDRLFKKLKQLSPDSEFTQLKHMGINKLHEVARLTDSPKLLIAAIMVEQKADSMAIEEIHNLVEEMLKFEATQLDSSAKSGSPATIEPPSLATAISDTVAGVTQNALAITDEPNERLGKALENLSSMIRQLNENVSRISTSELPSPEKSTAETTKTIAKLCSTVRKLSYYVKKLENLFASNLYDRSQSENNEPNINTKAPAAASKS